MHTDQAGTPDTALTFPVMGVLTLLGLGKSSGI
jgi:hypothetical protein